MTPNNGTKQDSVPSSRDSLAGAGWRCQRPGSYRDLIPAEDRGRHFSWLDPRTLWQSRRNEWIARFLVDPVDDERRRLVAAQRQRLNAPKDFIIDRSELDSPRFLVLGDTGEGDDSQFALVPSLLEVGKIHTSWSSAAMLSIQMGT